MLHSHLSEGERHDDGRGEKQRRADHHTKSQQAERDAAQKHDVATVEHARRHHGEEVARRLCAAPVRAISELRKGANSRIFRVETGDGAFALKKYPSTDDRNRLQAEVNALRFFERRGIDRTPRIVAVAPEPTLADLFSRMPAQTPPAGPLRLAARRDRGAAGSSGR